MTRILLLAGAIAAIVLGLFGYRLQKRYRAAIDYAGIGRPYPIGNSLLAFAGIAVMIMAIASAGVILMLLLVGA